MGFRFRGRVGIFKGFALNFGKSGLTSASIGRRGLTFNVGRKGTRTTIGLPGTGISYQTKLHPYDTHPPAPHLPPPHPAAPLVDHTSDDTSDPRLMSPAPPSTTVPWWIIFITIALIMGLISLFR